MASQVIENPADMDAVLQAVVNFAVANAGFTDQGNAGPVLIDFDRNGETPTTGTTGNVYRIAKDGIFWHFGFSSLRQLGTTSGNCHLYGALMSTQLQSAMNGFNNRGTHSQEEYTSTPLYTLSGPYENLYLYSQGDSVSMVLEITPNVFTHLSFGTLTKFGTYTGGQFLTVVDPRAYSSSTGWDNDATDINPIFPDAATSKSAVTSYVYLPSNNPSAINPRDSFVLMGNVDSNISANKAAAYGCVPWDAGNNPAIASDSPDTQTYSVNSKRSTLYGFPLLSGRQVSQNRTVTLPVLLRARTIDIEQPVIESNDLNNRFPIQFIGQVEQARVANIYSADPKDIIDTNWRVFPLVQKSGSTFSGPITGEVGLAYLED